MTYKGQTEESIPLALFKGLRKTLRKLHMLALYTQPANCNIVVPDHASRCRAIAILDLPRKIIRILLATALRRIKD